MKFFVVFAILSIFCGCAAQDGEAVARLLLKEVTTAFTNRDKAAFDLLFVDKVTFQACNGEKYNKDTIITYLLQLPTDGSYNAELKSAASVHHKLQAIVALTGFSGINEVNVRIGWADAWKIIDVVQSACP